MTLTEPIATAEFVCELVTRRQQVSPKRLSDPGPTPEQVAMLWKAAAQAPDHGLILPWRFVQVPVLCGLDQRQALPEHGQKGESVVIVLDDFQFVVQPAVLDDGLDPAAMVGLTVLHGEIDDRAAHTLRDIPEATENASSGGDRQSRCQGYPGLAQAIRAGE